MSARQMYSTSIKSPFPPHPLPWLQSLPAFVVPPPPVQMPGWDGRQLTSRWPSPCAAFLLGVPRPPPPWDTSQCACALSPWQTDSSNPSDGLNRAISAFFFFKLPKQARCRRAAAGETQALAVAARQVWHKTQRTQSPATRREDHGRSRGMLRTWCSRCGANPSRMGPWGCPNGGLGGGPLRLLFCLSRAAGWQRDVGAEALV